MKPLKIAIDFDDTFTAAPEFWSKVINLAKEFGHSVCVVTCRRRTIENTAMINAELDKHGCQMPIHLTTLNSKLEYMSKLGINIDIWIDDDPEKLVRGH